MGVIEDLRERKTLMTTEEVAAILGVKPAAVRYHIKAGHIAAVRLTPKAFRFTPDAVANFIEQQTTSSEAK